MGVPGAQGRGVAAGRTAQRLPELAAHGAPVLVLLFPLSSVAVHFAQPGFSPLDVALSYYMNGRLGWALGAGLVALGVGSLLLASGIRAVLGRTAPRTSLGLLAVWGIGCVIGGLFPPDAYGHWAGPPSVSGMVHGIAAMTAFIAFPIAALGLSKPGRLCGRGAGPLRAMARVCAAATLLMFACLVPAFLDRPPYALGLAERVALACFTGWLLLAGRVVWRGTGGAESRS